MTEDEMTGWHHRINGQEFEQTLGDGEGQGRLRHCSPWSQSQGVRQDLASDQQQQTRTYVSHSKVVILKIIIRRVFKY